MAEENAAAKEEPARFMIQKIYTKDISFETPNSPVIFREEWKTDLDLQLTTEYNKIDDTNHEPSLTLSRKEVILLPYHGVRGTRTYFTTIYSTPT